MRHRTPNQRECPRPAAQRYWIVQRLGSGGLGVVYEAIDARPSGRVALKVLRQGRSDPASARNALEREAAAMTRAAGPGVCRAYGVSECCGQPCLVMERLVGCTLQARLAARRMHMRSAIAMAAQIAAALQTIHRAGVIHSDIKPANVFITERGRIKILDFGLATTTDAPAAGSGAGRAAAHDVLGTASYIAPERILGATVDERSDLFSLGAVLYEMAFGRSPFAAATPAEVIFNVLENDPPSAPMQSGGAVAFERLVRILLDKNPARRCRSAAEVRRALVRLSKQHAGVRACVNVPGHTRGVDNACVHAEIR